MITDGENFLGLEVGKEMELYAEGSKVGRTNLSVSAGRINLSVSAEFLKGREHNLRGHLTLGLRVGA